MILENSIYECDYNNQVYIDQEVNMLVVHVHVHVKPDSVEAFKLATNRKCSSQRA